VVPLIPRVLVIDHYDSFTANLVDLVAGITGAEPTVVQHDRLDAESLLTDGFTHVVLSPGPGDPTKVPDFSAGRHIVRHADVPVLGVCLGMQGLVTSLGGRVEQCAPAHGSLSIVRQTGSAMFDGIPASFRAVRYHSLSATRLPDSLRATAVCDGPEGPIIMAVEHRSRLLFGVQFHPESILAEHGTRLIANFIRSSPDFREHRRPTLLSHARRSSRPPAAPGASVKSAWASRELTWVDPDAVHRLYAAEHSRGFWMDNEARILPHERISYLGWLRPEDVSLTAGAGRTTTQLGNRITSSSSEDVFAFLQRGLDDIDDLAPPCGPALTFTGGWVGFAGYASRSDLPARSDPKGAAPDSCFMWAERFLAFDHVSRRLFAISRDLCPDAWFAEAATAVEIASSGSQTPRDSDVPTTGSWAGFRAEAPSPEYEKAFSAVQEALRRGDSYETNLTFRLRLTGDLDAPTSFGRVRSYNAAEYSGLFWHDDMTLLMSSPERFCTVDRQGVITTRPLKGTVARGRSVDEDEGLRASLNDERFVAENLMVTDMARHDLNTICERGSVTVDDLMTVTSHPSVHHLGSTVRGVLKTSVSTVNAIRSIFPPASMTGAPRRRTMAIIAANETTPRGPYAGAAGWIGLNGCCDLGVVIRSAVATQGVVDVGTGGAITIYSSLESERLEAEIKISRLVETILGPTTVRSTASQS